MHWPQGRSETRYPAEVGECASDQKVAELTGVASCLVAKSPKLKLK